MLHYLAGHGSETDQPVNPEGFFPFLKMEVMYFVLKSVGTSPERQC